MAEVLVSTLEEFLNAIGTSGNIVKLAGDIDANGYIFSSIKYVNANIDGDGFTIYNIQDQGPNNTHVIFYLALGISIRNLNLTNIYIDGPLFGCGQDVQYRWPQIQNCTFQGRLLSFYSSGGGGCKITSSVFSFTETTSTNMLFPFYSSNSFISQSFIDFGKSKFSYSTSQGGLAFNCPVSNCFITGELQLKESYKDYLLSSRCENCIINVKCTYASGVSSSNIVFGISNNQSMITLYNTSKIQTGVRVGNGVVGLTDEQLKSREDILNTGFPLM